jgi:predicted membrane chloride channel (bestrophin family)
MPRIWFGNTYTVTYDSSNPLSLLAQKVGSIWPELLRYCILNSFVMAMLHILCAYGIELDISGEGHRYMSVVLSFLLVSRVRTAVKRYYQARQYLENMNKFSVELLHFAIVYTNKDDSLAAKEWRSEVAYMMMILLRSAMAVLDFPSSGVPILKLSELEGDVLDDLECNLPPTRWLHEVRTEYEENFRIPVRMAYLARKSIRSQEGRVVPAIAVAAEAHMHRYLNWCMDAFFGLRKLATTPVPFALLQMTSTFLWFYIFTVPFALLTDDTGIKSAIAHCLEIFIMTFGFVGMEYVAVQMDDPFGGDENDFK